MHSKTQTFWTKRTRLAILLVAILVIGAAVGWNLTRSRTQPRPEIPSKTITLAELEDQYGLRVNLVAVTAAGGMVDLRLKVVDGDKAKPLVLAPTGPPTLWIAEGNVLLAANTDPRELEALFESGNLFLLFPNSQGIVKPGAPVSIVLGSVKTEPVISQ